MVLKLFHSKKTSGFDEECFVNLCLTQESFLSTAAQGWRADRGNVWWLVDFWQTCPSPRCTECPSWAQQMCISADRQRYTQSVLILNLLKIMKYLLTVVYNGAVTSPCQTGLMVFAMIADRRSCPWWLKTGKTLLFPGWMDIFRYGSGLKNMPFFKPVARRSAKKRHLKKQRGFVTSKG